MRDTRTSPYEEKTLGSSLSSSSSPPAHDNSASSSSSPRSSSSSLFDKNGVDEIMAMYDDSYSSGCIGPAALASEIRKKRKEESERAEREKTQRMETKRECGGSEEEGEKKHEKEDERRRRGRNPTQKWTSDAIVQMLIKHGKFVKKPKVSFTNGTYTQTDVTEDELVAELQYLMKDKPHVVLERHGCCMDDGHLQFFQTSYAASPEVQVRNT
ncbi:hypothetical protein CSUI_009062 [Cystoisospora suis]|uniref:Uncharacterized protein n=1 Tax=Cystoisospora suis TaxID=483139 RepID=A0A2C6KHV4_9APIC|nr:hypothetical protein CSUI_009062 [Cystoisospora suis]